ncbi:hypothetical protein CDAR_368891 [Caerostris darwini]|uniref:Uncharacterized protein n=1 Tax=Caerostris darwini TaxID=1538125 RepID=A0AAV4NHA4_9ARAC|nr:hypothetical protein CDAR_368891 [Caerostris darwini]
MIHQMPPGGNFSPSGTFHQEQHKVPHVLLAGQTTQIKRKSVISEAAAGRTDDSLSLRVGGGMEAGKKNDLSEGDESASNETRVTHRMVKEKLKKKKSW